MVSTFQTKKNRPKNWRNPYKEMLEDIRKGRIVWHLLGPSTIEDILERQSEAFERGADTLLKLQEEESGL